jgi:hypothetical protein
VTFEEIDRKLTDWKLRLQRAGDNLMELTQLLTYKRLAGEDGWPQAKLTGISAERVAPALSMVRELWLQYALLTDVANRARQLHESLSRLLPSRKILDEIEQLLHGPSIKLPPTMTPLGQRGLLSEGEVAPAISPEQLLQAMAKRFDVARDTILAVDAAWERLVPRLSEQEAEAVSLQRFAQTLGEARLSDLEEIQQRIHALPQCIEQDPLGTAAQAAEVERRLQQIRGQLEQRAQKQAQVQAELRAARDLLRRLEEAHRQARHACTEREQKVHVDPSRPLPTPLEDDAIAALVPWLDRLEETIRNGSWQAAHVGLQKWTGIAQGYLGTEEAAREANRGLLRQHRDLRGLLEALQAKAQANGRAEDAELASLSREAWRLLHSCPTPLARLQEAITKYETRLL